MIYRGTTEPRRTDHNMKTIQKILVAAGPVAAIGFAVLEARLAAHWVNKVAAKTRQLDPLLEQFRQLRQERDEMTNKLATTRQI